MLVQLFYCMLVGKPVYHRMQCSHNVRVLLLLYGKVAFTRLSTDSGRLEYEQNSARRIFSLSFMVVVGFWGMRLMK